MATAHSAPSTASLGLEIDWNLSEPTTIAPAPVAPDEEVTIETTVDPRIAAEVRTAAPLPLSTWSHQTMAGQGAQDLIEAERAVLEAHGLASKDDKELFYAAGTALAQIGHDNLTRYEERFNALPEPVEAAAQFTRMIAEEGRHDMVADLVGYRINAAGRLAHVDAINGVAPDGRMVRGMDVSRSAWRQLAEIAGGPNVNAGLHKRTRAERKLRTRDNVTEGRETFGIVSTDGYAVLDGHQVADMMVRALRARGMESGTKMDVTYDRDTTRYQVRAIVRAPIDIPALWGVGRVHQAFVQVSGGDDGNCSLKGQAGAIRVRCLNASLAQLDGAQWTQAHKGDLSRLTALVAGTVDQFGALAASLREVWSRAAAHHYLDTDGTELSVTEAIGRLVAHKHVPTGGMTDEEATDRYVQAWKAEADTPTSAAGILMAIQRAAHESTWRTKWSTADIEEAASNLLYQPVWTLAEVEA